MTTINAGKLRAIGYDSSKRALRIELDNGNALEYANVGESIWRNFKSAGSQWSFYRDNIEEAFTATPVSSIKKTANESSNSGKNPLDDLFK